MKKNLKNIIITVILAFIIYYLALPAINITSLGFWTYLVGIIAVYSFLNLVTNLDRKGFYIGGLKWRKV